MLSAPSPMSLRTVNLCGVRCMITNLDRRPQLRCQVTTTARSMLTRDRLIGDVLKSLPRPASPAVTSLASHCQRARKLRRHSVRASLTIEPGGRTNRKTDNTVCFGHQQRLLMHVANSSDCWSQKPTDSALLAAVDAAASVSTPDIRSWPFADFATSMTAFTCIGI